MSLVLLERQGHVAVLTLNDPKRKNAMSVALGDALQERVRELQHDGDLRAVVLTGAGGAFSGGGDLAMLEHLTSVSAAEAKEFMLAFYGRYLSILELPCPVVAAVVGPAIGAGLAVALACHQLIVDSDAKLALNFAALGLYPGMGCTFTAPLRVGRLRAAELLLTGRRFDGREATQLGISLSHHPADAVLGQALSLANRIAANGPLATRRLAAELGLDRAALQQALEREATLQAESYGSDDLKLGLAAARERQTPTFVGR